MRRTLPFLVLILLSCQEKTQDTSASTIPSARKAPFRVIKYQRQSQICASPDSLCATVQLVYPVFERGVAPTLNDSLQADLVAYSGLANPDGPRPTSPVALGREFTGNFDAFVRSQGGQPVYGNVWSLDVKARPLRRTPTYLGVQIDAYAYEGGAHGNYFTRFVNYDPRTGHRITLDDLIQPGQQVQLQALAERQFRQQEGLKPDQKLGEEYFFENGQFRLNDNFTLTAGGLRFVYNPYEIKPYAAGQTTLELPWSAVRPLLRPDAPVE